MSSSWFLTDDLVEYLLAHSTPREPLLADLAAETAALGRPAGMQIAAEQGGLLTLLTQLVGARNAVEVGTFTGYSSICIARGLAPGGHLLCCDVSTEWTDVARRYWARAGVASSVELVIAPARETLAALPAEPVVDLAFVDADKTSYPDYFELLVDRLRPGGLLLADNTLQGGGVLDEADHSASVEAIRTFNELVASDERVDVVLLPVGDGLTVARRRVPAPGDPLA